MRKTERHLLGEHLAVHPMLGAGILEEQEKIEEFPNGLTSYGAGQISQIVPGLVDVAFSDGDSDDDSDDGRRHAYENSFSHGGGALNGAHSTLLAGRSPHGYLAVSAVDYFPAWDSLPDKFLISDWGTLAAYFKAFVGAGVLFLPHAFKSGGLTASTLTFVVTTILSTLCMLKMVEAKTRIVEDFRAGITHGIEKTHEIISFGMLGACVWGAAGRFIVDFSIAVSQLCFATAYLIFISKNVHNIIWQWGNCADEYNFSPIVIIWLAVPLLVPTMFIRHLAKFAVSIAIADTLIVLGLLFLAYRSGEAMVQQGGLGPGIVQFDMGGYPEFLGTALYALEGTAFVLPIQHAMKNKHHFPRVTAISGLGIGFMYMAFGLIGYMAFGSSVEAVITLNLKHRNPHDWTATAVQLAYCVALVLAFPVALFPVVRVVEAKLFPAASAASAIVDASLGAEASTPRIASAASTALSTPSSATPHGSPGKAGSTPFHRGKTGSLATSASSSSCCSRTWLKNGVRTLLTIFCATVATGGGSSFANFVALVGGIMCVPLTLIYPAYFHLRLCGDRATWWQRAEDIACLVVGVLGTVACTSVSIWQWSQGGAGDPDTCSPV